MLQNYSDFQQTLKYFPTPDGRIAYFDEGKGQCILLLHGVPTSAWLYRKIMPKLLESGYRVIAPDMLGFGASDKPQGYEVYAHQKMGKRLLDLMQFLGIPTWTHVFHDAGGLWTWSMLEQDNTKVEQLIMLNTIVYKEGFLPPFTLKKGWIAKAYSRMYSQPLLLRIMIYITMRNGLDDRKGMNNNMLEGYKFPLRKTGHPYMYYFFTKIGEDLPDYSALHRSLPMSLSVIWGKSDEFLVFKNIKAKVLENFNITEEDIHLLDGKHFIQEENSAQVSALILEKMNKN